MAKRVFFVTGLPRSRTAWLANLLTENKSVCWHELTGTLNSIAELKDLVERAETEIVGVSEPTLLPHWSEINQLLPDARWVFVRRDKVECARSYSAAFPDNSLVQADYDKWEEQMADAEKAVGNRGLTVRYQDLESYDVCSRIMRFTTGQELDFVRWGVLDKLRVTTLAEKVVPYLHPRVRRMIRSSWRPDTAWAAFQADAVKACGDNIHAQVWLLDVFNLALTWDHLADNDPLDLDVADDVFEAVLLRWPTNEFWRANQVLLIPVLSNAIAAWRGGDGYQVYVDIPLAIAYILGGSDARDALNKQLRMSAANLRKHDDQKDGGLWVA